MKSRVRKPRSARRLAPASSTDPVAEVTPAGPDGEIASDHAASGSVPWLERLFVPAVFVILAVAAALRLPELALNPFHHDEGVNGFFTTNLVRNGVYAYDPANYHGPTLYYFALASEVLFGLTTEAMRLVPVFFGLVMVAAIFALRPILGTVPVLTAGALLAISPGAVYISRYFIHEALLVCFSVTLVVALLLYIRSRRPVLLLAAAATAALIFATKETGIITVIVLGIAAVVSGVYVDLRAARSEGGRHGRGTRPSPKTRRAARSIWVDGVEYRATESGTARARRTGLRDIPTELAAGALIVFLIIYVLFFSSFFTNFPKGLIDSLATFTIWTQTGQETQVQPFHQYLGWMARAEAPILILGTIGGLIAALRARERVWVFIGLWALGLTLAYSLVSYKTPWIVLNMIVPLALLAGLAIRDVLASRRWRLVAPVALVAAVGLSGYQAIDLNYRHYDDETYPYVFVHTTRDTLAMLDEIEAVSERAGTGLETGVVVTSPEYWPLPWYMRDYPRAGFFGAIVETEEAVIVANVNQRDELAPALQGRYRSTGTYTLRPGVDLELYVRSDVAEP